MIEHYTGSMFTSQAHGIICPVNGYGKITETIQEFINRYPHLELRYLEYCQLNLLKPGKIIVLTPERPFIILFSIQYKTEATRLDWIKNGLFELSELLKKNEQDPIRIALEPFGEQLSWTVIESFIQQYFAASKNIIEIWSK